LSIGSGLPRLDGAAKVAGGALYVDDYRPDGCLYGATVRAPVARARLVSIERDPDYDWTDISLVTARDIPGENAVYLMTRDQPALADGFIRHAEEPVALVAAPTRDRALEAARHVKLTLEELPALTDYTASIGSDITIYPPDNVFKHIGVQKGDPDTVIAGRMISGEYLVGHQEQLYIEPQGVLASPRPDGGVTILGSMQCPYYIIHALTGILGHEKINVVQATTGGGFGGKEEYPSMVAAHAALLSLKTGRPVKLVYRRDEDLRATTKRHPARVRVNTRVDDTGRLLSFHADLLMDGGAYLTLSPVVLSRAVLHATGPYRCPHVRITGSIVATNTPPNGAFRGFGAPQAMFAVERHLDRVARSLCLDPVAVRRTNLLRNGDTTATGQSLTDTGGLAVLTAALKAAEEPLAFTPPRPGAGDEIGLIQPGRGVSLVFHGCGFTGNGEARLKGEVALELTGGGERARITVLTASTELGQGTDTILPQIVAEALGVPVSSVEVAPHDTARVPDSGPTVASRTAMVVGGVCLEAARALDRALEGIGEGGAPFAARMAARPADAPALVVSHAYDDDGGLQWDDATYRGDAYPTYGWSCSVVDLGVNVDTGEVTYRRFISATDVGRALNPVLAAGQIEGGSLQALGYATCEEVVLDSRGIMVNDRLTNYIIPTALDAPEMVTLLVEIPYAGGPFGAKGIGEIPMDGPAAAVAQAIEDATGAVLDALPMTPERVLAALPAGKPGH